MPAAQPILVVDDDSDVREALGEVLAEEGYDTRLFESGRAALAFLRGGGDPSLILLDMMMPEMNGWQFREEQLKDERLRDIPVVVITASRVEPDGIQRPRGAVQAGGAGRAGGRGPPQRALIAPARASPERRTARPGSLEPGASGAASAAKTTALGQRAPADGQRGHPDAGRGHVGLGAHPDHAPGAGLGQHLADQRLVEGVAALHAR